MATAVDIYNVLDEIMPFSQQESWDNSGILINSGADSHRVLVCLDVTKEAVQKAVEIGAQVIVSHHPVIFKGIKQIEKSSVVYSLIEKGISVVSAHTNFDICSKGTCFALCSRLGLNIVEKGQDFGVIAENTKKENCAELATRCKQAFGRAYYTLGQKKAEKIFVCSGSGSGMNEQVLKSKADCFITGECKYHDVLDLSAEGVSVITIGHDLSEYPGVKQMKKILESKFTNDEFVLYEEKRIVTQI